MSLATQQYGQKIQKQLLDTGLDSFKTASKKLFHKTSEFLENKSADAITKSSNDKILKPGPVEGMIIPIEKRDEILKVLRRILS